MSPSRLGIFTCGSVLATLVRIDVRKAAARNDKMQAVRRDDAVEQMMRRARHPAARLERADAHGAGKHSACESGARLSRRPSPATRGTVTAPGDVWIWSRLLPSETVVSGAHRPRCEGRNAAP